MSTCVLSEEEEKEEGEGDYKNDSFNRIELNWLTNIVGWFHEAGSTYYQKMWDNIWQTEKLLIVSFFLHRNGEYVSVIQTETPNHMKSAVSA